jgi:hypothetical protein
MIIVPGVQIVAGSVRGRPGLCQPVHLSEEDLGFLFGS